MHGRGLRAVPAASKHTAVAFLSSALVAALALAGSTGAVRPADQKDREAPSAPTNIRASSATPSSVSFAWDRSTDNVGVAGYYVYVDGSRDSRILSSTQYTATGLGCGESVGVQIVALDYKRNRSPAATATLSTAACLDVQAPTPPSGFRQAATTQEAVVLVWDPSVDDVGVVAYGVYRNNLPVHSASEPSVTLTGLVCGVAVEYDVDAVDAAGNRSERRSAWVQTLPCSAPPPPATDTTPPSDPANLAVAGSTSTSVALTWSPSSDDVGVSGYRVYVNGATVLDPEQPGAIVPGLSCASAFSFEVDAVDAAGNRSRRARVTASTTECVQPPAPAADTIPPSQPGALAVTSVSADSISLTWAASTDNVSVTGYSAYRSGTMVTSVTQPGTTVSGLSCGTAYALAVDAYDAAGNRSGKASLVTTTSPCPDTQPPSAPANVNATSRTATSIALSWATSSDNVGVTGYGLYLSGTRVGTSAVTSGIFSSLTCNTNYTLAVDAYDAAGNRSVKATYMVATTACPDSSPPTPPTGLAVSQVTQTSLTLTWSASTDDVGVTGYDVYRNGTKMSSAASTSSSQSGLTCGTSYAFGVEALDAAGNRSTRVSVNANTSPCSVPPPPPPPSSNVYYVAPSGSDSANGSQASPWRTLAKACTAVPAGSSIVVAAGTYVETATCNLKSGVNLDGAGIDQTVIRGSMDTLVLIQGTTAGQTVSDLTLDGQSRTTANYGLKALDTTALKVLRVKALGFKGPSNYSGGNLHFQGGTDLELAFSEIRNGGGSGGAYCSGALGLGDLTRAKIHDNVVSTDQGYAVKGTGSFIRDSEIWNNAFDALSSSCSSWNTLTVELFNTDPLNTRIHNNHFNGVLSITDTGSAGALSSGYRYRIDHNVFQLTQTDQFYGIELDMHSTEIDHNYFDFRVKGVYAIFNTTSQVKAGNKIHHNVFDGKAGPTLIAHITAGVNGWEFTNNTAIGRQSTWRDGYFSLGPGGPISLQDNIFLSTVAIGDKLGIGLNAATIDHNSFYNIASKGTNAVGGNPSLSLSGDFPAAYLPIPGSPAAGLGAFADGTWTAGPS